MPAKLGVNRTTFRGVRSSITTFSKCFFGFPSRTEIIEVEVIDGKNQKILGKIKKFFVINFDAILYIAGPLNLLFGEIFHDLFYSLRYNNKEFLICPKFFDVCLRIPEASNRFI